MQNNTNLVYDSHKVYFFSVNISWVEAFEICQKAGGHLPFLKDENNKDLLNQKVYAFLVERHEPPNQLSMGDITFLGLIRKVSMIQAMNKQPMESSSLHNAMYV